MKKMLKDEDRFGIKKYKTYQNFGKKVYEIRKMFLRILKN